MASSEPMDIPAAGQGVGSIPSYPVESQYTSSYAGSMDESFSDAESEPGIAWELRGRAGTEHLTTGPTAEGSTLESPLLRRAASLDNIPAWGEFGSVLGTINKTKTTERLIAGSLHRVSMQKEKVVQRARQQKEKAQGVLRRVVTGDQSKRVRDHLKEPVGMRLVDKLSFTLGVINLATTEFVLLVIPEYFWVWYTVIMPILLFIRFDMYRKRKWDYFLYDFCYYTQALCFAAIYVFPACTWLWQANFVFANGPLLFAIIAWHNSLVFHSLDKITSVYIHLFPSLIIYAERWLVPMHTGTVPAMCYTSACEMSWMNAMVYPLCVYVTWQVAYYAKVEVFDRSKLDNDPDIVTSLRWLARDTRNGMHIATVKFCVRWGIMSKGEKIDATVFKYKLIFMGAQMLYTVVCILPMKFFFTSFWFHTAYIVLIMCGCVWNGANYYIEDFSTKYVLKFQPRQPRTKDQ